MAKPIQVQADPDVLGRIAAQAASSVSEMAARLKAIDQSLEGLKQYWAGTSYYSFYGQFENTRAVKDDAIKQLETFCTGAFAAVPKEYESLESTIKTEVQKLRNGQL